MDINVFNAPQGNESTYSKFIEWNALPEPFREPHNMQEFGEKYGVDRRTLHLWKKRDGFWQEVNKASKIFFKDKTPNVVMKIYQKAMQGDVQAMKLWMQTVEDWSEKVETRSSISYEVMIVRMQKELIEKGLINRWGDLKVLEDARLDREDTE